MIRRPRLRSPRTPDDLPPSARRAATAVPGTETAPRLTAGIAPTADRWLTLRPYRIAGMEVVNRTDPTAACPV